MLPIAGPHHWKAFCDTGEGLVLGVGLVSGAFELIWQ